MTLARNAINNNSLTHSLSHREIILCALSLLWCDIFGSIWIMMKARVAHTRESASARALLLWLICFQHPAFESHRAHRQLVAGRATCAMCLRIQRSYGLIVFINAFRSSSWHAGGWDLPHVAGGPNIFTPPLSLSLSIYICILYVCWASAAAAGEATLWRKYLRPRMLPLLVLYMI